MSARLDAPRTRKTPPCPIAPPDDWIAIPGTEALNSVCTSLGGAISVIAETSTLETALPCERMVSPPAVPEMTTWSSCTASLVMAITIPVSPARTCRVSRWCPRWVISSVAVAVATITRNSPRASVTAVRPPPATVMRASASGARDAASTTRPETIESAAIRWLVVMIGSAAASVTFRAATSGMSGVPAPGTTTIWFSRSS